MDSEDTKCGSHTREIVLADNDSSTSEWKRMYMNWQWQFLLRLDRISIKGLKIQPMSTVTL